MKKNLFLIFIVSPFILTFPSCIPITKLIYGVKAPDYENTETLAEFQEKWFGIDDTVITLSAQAYLTNQLPSIPDILVFDRYGNFIPYRDTSRPNCNGPAELFLAELDPGRTYYKNDSLMLDEFTRLLQKGSCQSFVLNKLPETDFYVFMSWAKWTGKRLYQEKSSHWIESLRNNKKIKYQFYLLNTDFQECWTQAEKMQMDSDYD